MCWSLVSLPTSIAGPSLGIVEGQGHRYPRRRYDSRGAAELALRGGGRPAKAIQANFIGELFAAEVRGFESDLPRALHTLGGALSAASNGQLADLTSQTVIAGQVSPAKRDKVSSFRGPRKLVLHGPSERGRSPTLRCEPA